MYLRNTKVTKLPKNLTVKGNLYLTGTAITELPNDLTVGGEIQGIDKSIIDDWKQRIEKHSMIKQSSIITDFIQTEFGRLQAPEDRKKLIDLIRTEKISIEGMNYTNFTESDKSFIDNLYINDIDKLGQKYKKLINDYSTTN